MYAIKESWTGHALCLAAGAREVTNDCVMTMHAWQRAISYGQIPREYFRYNFSMTSLTSP